MNYSISENLCIIINGILNATGMAVSGTNLDGAEKALTLCEKGLSLYEKSLQLLYDANCAIKKVEEESK